MAIGTSTDTGTGRAVTSRPVMFTGLAIGTAVTVLAVWDGLRLNVPGAPSILRVVLGVLLLWALFAALGAVLSELTVRHHRAVLRHGWRHGKRGGRAAARRAGVAYRGVVDRSRPWRTRTLTAIRTRWAARGTEPPDSRWPITLGPDPDPAAPLPPDPAPSPERRVCAACGNPEGGKFGPLVAYRETDGETHLIHLAHFEDPDTGFYGQPHSPAPSPTGTTPPGETMTETHTPYQPGMSYKSGQLSKSIPGPQSGGGRRVLTIGTVPGEWKNLVAITADFEPEDDAHLLAWMASEVNGMSAYAEALTEVYETGVSSIGLDPVSLAALHDTADAAAEAAQAMASARQKFASHYQEVREFAASGGLLPHDGRWITGDGE
jgi:hypothetical protein